MKNNSLENSSAYQLLKAKKQYLSSNYTPRIGTEILNPKNKVEEKINQLIRLEKENKETANNAYQKAKKQLKTALKEYLTFEKQEDLISFIEENNITEKNTFSQFTIAGILLTKLEIQKLLLNTPFIEKNNKGLKDFNNKFYLKSLRNFYKLYINVEEQQNSPVFKDF